MANGTGEGKARRSYRPAVESLDALRLPSGAPQTLPGLAAAYDLFGPASAPIETHAPAVSDATWDTALVDHELADVFDAAWQSVQDEDVAAGLAQLDRYLNRTWYRAGVVLQQHDDCSQAVYATLLLLMGRGRFDQLIGEVGRRGVRNVLNRETHVGPDFFRAVDAVKKRAGAHDGSSLSTRSTRRTPPATTRRGRVGVMPCKRPSIGRSASARPR